MQKQRKSHSEETKKKIARGNTGKVFSQSRKDAIGRANRKKLSKDVLTAAAKILDEKCCSFDAAMIHLGLNPTRALRDALIRNEIEIIDDLKFFNRSIDYKTGKKLLSYLRLGLHWTEIQERTGLTQKVIVGACSKFEKIHNFKYSPAPKPTRTGRTKIEEQVANFLDELNVEYESEFSFGNFFYDFRIKNTSLFLEVNGDYWHANPQIYSDSHLLNETQQKNVKRDHFKRKFARENGFYVLYLWEHDLKNSPEDTKIMLRRYIQKAYEKSNTFKFL